MSVIFLAWDYNGQEAAVRALERLGHRVLRLSVNASGNISEDPDFVRRFDALLEDAERAGDPCRFVFSHDFFPMASNACEKRGIPYISFVYDSPHYSLTSPATANAVNQIHVFDRGLVGELEAAGIRNLRHTLLSTDPGMAERAAEFEDLPYEHDISFVGSLYRDQYTFYDQIQGLPDTLREITDLAIAAQQKIFGVDLLGDPKMVPEKIIDMLRQYVHFDLSGDYQLDPGMLLRDILRKKVTSLERYEILRQLGESCDASVSQTSQAKETEPCLKCAAVDLYTTPGAQAPPGVRNLGYASYENDLPRIYSRSRINLNITLRTIRTGIPQRVFDIMACGGFVLSDYREELAETFAEGEELALARTPEDFVRLSAYYLEHEEERERIARAGQRKVLKEHIHDIIFRNLLEQAASGI